MRSESEIKNRLQDLQNGIYFWTKEVNRREKSFPEGYIQYAKCILGELSREIKILKWVLGEDIELPPAG